MTAKIHTTPCSQVDVIDNIKRNQDDIKTDVSALIKTIHGNGDGIGMKSNLLLVVERTKRLDEFLNKMEDKQDKEKAHKNSRLEIWIMAGTMIVMIIFGVLEHFHKL